MPTDHAQQAKATALREIAALAQSTQRRAERMQDASKAQALSALAAELGLLATGADGDGIGQNAKFHAAESLASLAERWRERHDTRLLAAGLFAQAVALTPNPTWAHWRGLLLMELGHFAEAELAFTQAVAISGEPDVYGEWAARAATLAAQAARGEQVHIPQEDAEPLSLSVEQEEQATRAAMEIALMLIDGHFAEAWALLTPAFQQRCSAQQLQAEYEDMQGDAEHPLETAYAMPYYLDNDDRIVIQLALRGEDARPFVFITLQAQADGRMLVDEIDEWGQP